MLDNKHPADPDPARLSGAALEAWVAQALALRQGGCGEAEVQRLARLLARELPPLVRALAQPPSPAANFERTLRELALD